MNFCHRCGNIGNYKLKDEKYSCSKHWTQCPESKKEISKKAKNQKKSFKEAKRISNNIILSIPYL